MNKFAYFCFDQRCADQLPRQGYAHVFFFFFNLNFNFCFEEAGRFISLIFFLTSIAARTCSKANK